MKDGIKILAAYDGSGYSKRAVEEAVDIAKKFKGSVTVLNVFWDPAQIAREDEVAAVEGIDVRDQPSLMILDDLEPGLKESKVKYELRSQRSEDAPSVIIGIAENEGYDLIAMGCRGLGRAKAWLLGSVSQKVVSESKCPVLIVK